jgi:hypothetical protein
MVTEQLVRLGACPQLGRDQGKQDEAAGLAELLAREDGQGVRAGPALVLEQKLGIGEQAAGVSATCSVKATSWLRSAPCTALAFSFMCSSVATGPGWVRLLTRVPPRLVRPGNWRPTGVQ